MTTYVLIHGAASDSWYWHLPVAELRTRGHDVVAPDLPCDDDTAGLPEYADTVIDAIGDRGDVVLVAQSFGGFTAPPVCDRVCVRLLVCSPRRFRGQVRRRATGGPTPAGSRLGANMTSASAWPWTTTPRCSCTTSRPSWPPKPQTYPRSVRNPVCPALDPELLASHTNEIPTVPRRPLLPRRVHAPCRR
jgi:hypothetical protein